MKKFLNNLFDEQPLWVLYLFVLSSVFLLFESILYITDALEGALLPIFIIANVFAIVLTATAFNFRNDKKFMAVIEILDTKIEEAETLEQLQEIKEIFEQAKTVSHGGHHTHILREEYNKIHILEHFIK